MEYCDRPFVLFPPVDLMIHSKRNTLRPLLMKVTSPIRRIASIAFKFLITKKGRNEYPNSPCAFGRWSCQKEYLFQRPIRLVSRRHLLLFPSFLANKGQAIDAT